MRELFLVGSESSETSLVFSDAEGEQYFIAVDDDLRQALNPTEAPEPEEQAPEPEPSPPETVEASRNLPQPDPLFSTPLSLRPREIQARIRSGTSPEELADEMGVAVSRLDPYSHPVMLERSQIAELAKSSHPVREDGPAKLTLWEVLAAAFGARGHNLADSIWDAYREPGGEWVAQVRWTAGLSENMAEWTFKHHTTSASTTEARNAIAADVTDPDFVQPVRTLTSIGRGGRYDRDIEDEEDEEALDATPEAESSEEPEAAESDESLQAPDPQEAPTKRRRKAVTPHWEDVLLGVRTNTKRPRQ